MSRMENRGERNAAVLELGAAALDKAGDNLDVASQILIAACAERGITDQLVSLGAKKAVHDISESRRAAAYKATKALAKENWTIPEGPARRMAAVAATMRSLYDFPLPGNTADQPTKKPRRRPRRFAKTKMS